MHVYIIAEAGVNHNGNIELAKKLIDAAVDAGCDAVKFQTFRADSIVTRTAQKACYQKNNDNLSETQYEMLKRLELSRSEHITLIEYCNQKNIKFLSTPFDENSADLLDELGVNEFKVSSGDLTNKPLLEHLAKKGKRIILSTGMAYLDEIEKAISWIYGAKNTNVLLMHCTSRYPAPPEAVNLNAISTMKNAFNLEVGYSDHTVGLTIPVAAVAMGAIAVEKHFTLDRNMQGPDHKASIEPQELKQMVESIRLVEKAMGSGVKAPAPGEEEMAKTARKSLVTARAVCAGQVISRDMITVKRPGTGISPENLARVLGMRFTRDLPADYVIETGDIHGEV